MLKNATAEFHRDYEKKHDHPARLNVYLFWDSEDLVMDEDDELAPKLELAKRK
ncbi:hypothetical protein AKJ08_1217 [Vulgatibacter incomptus]|uniref:Uncharacterized protein n=2 Tax=Vulgatibacter incomptus TaxID=1391653 RepID=A0A0K1PBC9_9BACT|nr:hypothetical protein AKJ08_1217 [Vulgatibacter incomptus]